MGEDFMLYVFVVVFVLAALWSALYGRDKRLLRSQAYCYKDLDVEPMSDEEFCWHPLLKEKEIPKTFILEKRQWLSDNLDFPYDRLRPEMIWEEIPLHPSPWMLDEEEIYDHVEKLGIDSANFFNGKSVAEIISGIYMVERESETKIPTS